jgi:NAD(P)-dependent dehydrogenase (short-subunit alcohol dehydrogenase family)
MAKTDATEMLRPGLLDGVPILLATARAANGRQAEGVAGAVGLACAALGAQVRECALIATGACQEDDAAVDAAVASTLSELGAARVLVVDAGALLLDPEAGSAGLVDALEATWRITRALANAAFIRGDGERRGEGGAGEAALAGGRIVYLAPPTAAGGHGEPEPAGAHAQAARAGLENLARTLSIEWARYGITSVAIAPGPGTSPGELAGVVAYLASPAGAYFSGCQLDLRGTAPDV